jgi:hypothetical protein
MLISWVTGNNRGNENPKSFQLLYPVTYSYPYNNNNIYIYIGKRVGVSARV